MCCHLSLPCLLCTGEEGLYIDRHWLTTICSVVCWCRVLPPLLTDLLTPPLSAHLCYSILPCLRRSGLGQRDLLSHAVHLVANNRLQASAELGFSLLLLFRSGVGESWATKKVTGWLCVLVWDDELCVAELCVLWCTLWRMWSIGYKCTRKNKSF